MLTTAPVVLRRVCSHQGDALQNLVETLVLYCRTTSASTAPCTSRRMCCPTHSYRAPCYPLLRAFSRWIRSPPLSKSGGTWAWLPAVCGRRSTCHRSVVHHVYCTTPWAGREIGILLPKTSASTAPFISRMVCCPTHCASYCAPCQPLLRAFSGWIRSQPSTLGRKEP